MFGRNGSKFLWSNTNYRFSMTKSFISFGSKKPKPVSLAYRAFEGTEGVSDLSPLIVVHGIFASKRQWKNLCLAIQQKTKPARKVIAVDLRNHGNSPHSPYHTYAHIAEDISNYLKENAIKSAALLGHNIGGRAVMYTALKNPEIVERLIVVDISPVATSKTLLNLESIFPKIKSMTIPPQLSMPGDREIIKRHLGRAVSDQTVLEYLLNNIKEIENGRLVWGQNVNAMHTNFKNMVHFPLEELLAFQYRGPSLFIGGSKSDYLKPSELEEVKRFFPKSELQLLDSGHEVHLEYPSELAKTVLSFINQ